MKFYLGTHETSWLGRAGLPLFVSHMRLMLRKQLPRAMAPWALDSGGFTQLSMHGTWTVSPREYAAAVYRYRDEIGQLEWAAPQDWMCEPFILAKTGCTVGRHQHETVRNYVDLRIIAPDLPFIPVLQGWTVDDYLRCADRYAAAGIDLEDEPLVGVGSVCRRQGTAEISHLIERLSPLRLHGFGLKTRGLVQIGHRLASADSMAWSYSGRRHPPMAGHTHASCANCLEYACRWRENLLAVLAGTAAQDCLDLGWEAA